MRRLNMRLFCLNPYGKLFILMMMAVLLLVPASMLYASGFFYQQHNLVSDGFITADHTDPQLVNAWGIAFNPNGPVWVNDNGTGVATLYDGDGVKQSLVVTIPPPAGGAPPSAPTGIVFNTTTDFVITKGNDSSSSFFIFATEDGTISAWAPTVDPTNAILVVDNSTFNTVYKGLALGANGKGHFLYATDFRHGKIDVFDSTFKQVTLSGSFEDPTIPKDFAPFGIRNINGDIYVTYAKQNQAKHDDVAGKGHGFVNVFDADGNLIQRFASRGHLNSPWGLALAPSDFGKFSNRLLVGNFGDGAINAFDIATGKFLGQLQTRGFRVLKIDGLWGISFGNGVRDQPTNQLFFAAGPDSENHGLYGFIVPE